MLVAEIEKHGVTLEQLLELSLSATRRGERKRYLLIYNLAYDTRNATAAAKKSGWCRGRAADVVKRFNEHGLEALKYRHSGGPRPLFRRRKSPSLRTP